MAVAGILIALQERARSGEGQFVDCSMFDGSLSFLAMLAGEMLADDSTPQRGELRLAGGIVCYRPYECADGYVTLGALEPKFWAEFCRGVGREDLLDHAFDPPGSAADRALSDIFAARTREQWRAFASEHECCLEPVLDLNEALDGDQVAARDMLIDLPQPGAERPVRLLGVPVKLSRTPADPTRAPGPGLGEHTRAVLVEAGYSAEEIDALLDAGAVAGPADGVPTSTFMS